MPLTVEHVTVDSQDAGAPAAAWAHRVHVDLGADDLGVETERLVGPGATVLQEKREHGAHCRTLSDPEGNEFCVLQRCDERG